VDRHVDFAVEQRPLDFFCEQPLPADLSQRAGLHIPLRRNVNQLDFDAALAQLRGNPLRLPAGQGTGASAET
jgi:hypothetical protein